MGSSEQDNKSSGSILSWEFLEELRISELFKKDFAPFS
jgi:hypothetical protein